MSTKQRLRNRRMRELLQFTAASIAALLLIHSPASAGDEKPKVGTETTAAPAAPPPPAPGSEYTCEADIIYKWRPTPHSLPASAGTPAKKSEEIEKESPVEVFFERTAARASSETEAKEILNRKISQLQAQALQTCTTEHQNRARCVAQRLKGNSDQYLMMDYSARRALLDAITMDCEDSSGICVGSGVGEITCFISQAAPTTTAETPSTPEKGGTTPEKGAKGKKK